MKRSSKEAALKIFGDQKYLFDDEAGVGSKQIISTLPLSCGLHCSTLAKGFKKCHTTTRIPFWEMSILNALFFKGHDFSYLSFLVL